MPAVGSAEPDESATEELQLVPVGVAQGDGHEGSPSVSLATLYQAQSVVQSWQSLAVPPLELGGHSQRCRSAIECITEVRLVSVCVHAHVCIQCKWCVLNACCTSA